MLSSAWRAGVNLKALNTLALPAVSAWYSRPTTVQAVVADVLAAKRGGIDLRVLGQGSNVILQDFDGITLTPALPGIKVREGRHEVLLEVGAGVDWAKLVHWCCKRGYHGLENLAMIPGSAGAAPVQNIGAYGLEISELLVAVTVLDVASCEVRLVSAAECEFRYRTSIFRDQPTRAIILALHLRLNRGLEPVLDYPDVAKLVATAKTESNTRTEVALYQAVCKLRTQKLPNLSETAHAGSFFHNPSLSRRHVQELSNEIPTLRSFPERDSEKVRVPAAQLVEACKWRGRKLGSAAVSAQHALVIINPGQATAEDICALAAAIQKDVEKAFSVELQLEPARL